MRTKEQVEKMLKHWKTQIKIHDELKNVTYNYGFMKALEWVLEEEEDDRTN